MTPDLRTPHKHELDQQTQWELFKTQLSYVLAYPDAGEPDVTDIPLRTNLVGSTPLNMTTQEFTDRFEHMTRNEVLGDDTNPLPIKAYGYKLVKEMPLVDDVYQNILGIVNTQSSDPLLLFWMHSISSGAMILVGKREEDLLDVLAVPIKGENEEQNEVLRELQKYLVPGIKPKSVADLLNIPGIKRGSDIANPSKKR